MIGTVDARWPIERQARAIDDASRSIGFFHVVGHGCELAPLWRTAAAFFDLPLDEKVAVAFPEPGYPYGYSPLAFETLASSLDGHTTPPDLKESLSVGPDCLGAHATSPIDADEAWIRSPSRWPARPHDLRPVWEAHYRAMSALCTRLMSAMALALDLPVTYFDSFIDHHTSAMRAIRYPPIIGDVEPGQLRAGAHTDYGTLTVLATDGVAGLEVCPVDGTWQPVPEVPGALVVNLGDSMAQWTNDRWRSTLHRVAVTEPHRQRHSVTFFHMANWDATIECLFPDEEPCHEPVRAGPWLMRKFQRTVG
jgi:isopenicillin N synthase-like dioxygenase